MHREDNGETANAILLDVVIKKIIHRQPSGLFQNCAIVVRFDTKDNRYHLFSASTGEQLGVLPDLPTETEFEFSATPDGSAFMIVGGMTKPEHKFVKYRYEVKSQQLQTMWELPLPVGNYPVGYEMSLRPASVFMMRLHSTSGVVLLLDAQNGVKHSLPGILLSHPWLKLQQLFFQLEVVDRIYISQQ